MGSTKKTDPLVAAVAVILAGASVGPAGAQARLDVYSDDFSGGSIPLPSSAVRPARIDMHIERLHVVRDGIAALRAQLGSHSHAPHQHRPHVHVDRTGFAGTANGDGADMVTVYSESEAGRTSSVHSSQLDANGRVSVYTGKDTDRHHYTQHYHQAATGDGDGGGGGY